eukprot:scaffold70699_cov15-Tisochrysis_lutea.AAC.1
MCAHKWKPKFQQPPAPASGSYPHPVNSRHEKKRRKTTEAAKFPHQLRKEGHIGAKTDERIFEAKLNHDCMMDASIPIPCQPAGHNQERWARYCMRGNKDESKFSLVYKSIISSAKQRA